MKNLQTLTAVYVAGKWLPPGSPLSSDLSGFDYEKHARKGMIEDTGGAEIINPVWETLPSPREEGKTDLELQKAQDEVERLTADIARLQGELETAQAAAASPHDLTALAEYRDVVGEMLPASFPGRKVLFENGYYTLDVVRGAPDEALTDLDGIAEGLLAKIREVAPFTTGE